MTILLQSPIRRFVLCRSYLVKPASPTMRGERRTERALLYRVSLFARDGSTGSLS